MKVLLLLVMAVSFGVTQGVQPDWPAVESVNTGVPIDLRSDRIEIDVPIKARDGAIAYTFGCRGGSDRYLESLHENWVGPLMCTLAAGARATEESLLSEDDSAAWYSRGQYHAEDLVGAHRQGRSCETVLRGNDVRMCRKANGSWEPCKG